MAAPVTITFLGGLGEIGRNCAAFEVEGRIMLLDCGILFPDTDMPGIDLVLPDFTWLLENADRIDGCVATHGHEDHVGGLSFLLRELASRRAGKGPFPIYGSPLTLGLARHRIDEAGLVKEADFIPVLDRERRRVGPFDLEFIPVAHSVPHGFATAFHTPQGTILHSGDWKLDLTPIDGRRTDLGLIGEIAKQRATDERSHPGIRLLLADSTNAEEPGHTQSERTVGAVLHDLFVANFGRRIVIACFASHIHRIQQICNAAVANGRIVATLGLSMKKNVKLARDMGLLKIPDRSLIDIDDIGDHDPAKVCVVSTGSQGEPLSALALMAAGENRRIKLGSEDTVILSSHPIPGNEGNVTRVIDGLTRLGVEVVHSGIAPVHASGHAKAEEVKTLIGVAEPEWFTPVHGEYRHLRQHARLAEQMGVDGTKVLVCEDGDQLVLTDDAVRRMERAVPAGYLYVDGIVGDVGHGVLRDRRVLAEEGVVVVVVTVDVSNRRVLAGPEIITRGWVHAQEAEDLLEECAAAVRVAVDGVLEHPESVELEALQRHVRKAAGKFVNDRTKRRPMIVPLVLEA